MASSLSDTESKGGQVVVIGVIFTVVAATTVALRLFTRLVILRSPGREDILMFLALATSITLTALTAKQVHYGLGRHFDILSPVERARNLKTLWISIIVYYISLALVKISILIQYLRIFSNKSTRITIWAILAFVNAYSLITMFASVFVCYPIRYFWEKTYTGPSNCLDQKALWFSNASLNIFSDLAILIAPMPALSSLRLPRRQKIGLMFIFALGGVTCIISVLRLHSLYVISVSTDPTWDNVGAATWSMVELNTGIICACLPILKSFVSRLFPDLLGTSRQPSTQKQDTETIGADSQHTKTIPKALASHNSLHEQNVKSGMRSDNSGTAVQVSDSENSLEDGKGYGNGV
ncbi:hypothetical protein BDZ45DRAFT_806100 [Acephala macrosclerotiorum]|nr:hypothetical protein BDZ45DRAFT_806100 [Acephala macrosclerotiorum]